MIDALTHDVDSGGHHRPVAWRHQWELVVIDPQRIVRHMRGGVMRHESDEQNRELGVAGMAPAIAECRNLLQCRRRRAKNPARHAQRGLIWRLLDSWSVPRQQPAVTGPGIRGSKK